MNSTSFIQVPPNADAGKAVPVAYTVPLPMLPELTPLILTVNPVVPSFQVPLISAAEKPLELAASSASLEHPSNIEVHTARQTKIFIFIYWIL
jgi:hypothetical protein